MYVCICVYNLISDDEHKQCIHIVYRYICVTTVYSQLTRIILEIFKLIYLGAKEIFSVLIHI